jgi:hypothetical protein
LTTITSPESRKGKGQKKETKDGDNCRVIYPYIFFFLVVFRPGMFPMILPTPTPTPSPAPSEPTGGGVGDSTPTPTPTPTTDNIFDSQPGASSGFGSDSSGEKSWSYSESPMSGDSDSETSLIGSIINFIKNLFD